MTLIRAFKIFIGWLSAGVVFGAGLIFTLNSLAGLGTLILFVSAVMIIVAPPIHILIARHQAKVGAQAASGGAVFMISFSAIFVLVILLSISGLFNFT